MGSKCPRRVVPRLDERARQPAAVDRLIEDVVVIPEVDGPRGQREVLDEREIREQDRMPDPEQSQPDARAIHLPARRPGPAFGAEAATGRGHGDLRLRSGWGALGRLRPRIRDPHRPRRRRGVRRHIRGRRLHPRVGRYQDDHGADGTVQEDHGLAALSMSGATRLLTSGSKNKTRAAGPSAGHCGGT